MPKKTRTSTPAPGIQLLPARTFKPGDRVIAQNFTEWPEMNGEHGIVVEDLVFDVWIGVNGSPKSGFVYEVDFSVSGLCTASPKNLRKKPDSRKKKLTKEFAVLGSWDAVGWSPNKAPVNEGSTK